MVTEIKFLDKNPVQGSGFRCSPALQLRVVGFGGAAEEVEEAIVARGAPSALGRPVTGRMKYQLTIMPWASLNK